MSSSSGVGSGSGSHPPFRLQDVILPRDLVVIMDAVGDKFKAIPITDLEQVPAIAQRLKQFAENPKHPIDPKGLPAAVKRAFEGIMELDSDPEFFNPSQDFFKTDARKELFHKFVAERAADYASYLESVLTRPEIAKIVLKEGADEVLRQEAAEYRKTHLNEALSKEDVEREQHRNAQQQVPQTLGLSQEAFDEQLAREMAGLLPLREQERIWPPRPGEERGWAALPPRNLGARGVRWTSTDPADFPHALRESGWLVDGPEGDRARWWLQLLEQHPVEGLQVREMVDLLGTNNPGIQADLVRRWQSLSEAGYTLSALRESIPSNIARHTDFTTLVWVAETSRARGRPANLIGRSDWLLTSILLFLNGREGINGLPISPEHLSGALQADLAEVVRADAQAELERWGARGNLVRQRLEELPPIEGLRAADVDFLCRREGGDIVGGWLDRYQGIRNAGFTLEVLRASSPRNSAASPPRFVPFPDLIRVAEAAMGRGHTPDQLDDSDWRSSRVLERSSDSHY
ncbi:MAG: hypothetical protein ACOYKZ_03300 [Chlamydiia bacterium]